MVQFGWLAMSIIYCLYFKCTNNTCIVCACLMLLTVHCIFSSGSISLHSTFLTQSFLFQLTDWKIIYPQTNLVSNPHVRLQVSTIPVTYHNNERNGKIQYDKRQVFTKYKEVFIRFLFSSYTILFSLGFP